ncbi:MAG: GNAT family N-acetyltransferase [Thermoanaerobacterales bacterium]|jgi:RimJ/RimL family protein N-acetyltransferase|nr:GNAT family N-acetyltransferase [Thermoanaerobacterales bacterium]
MNIRGEKVVLRRVKESDFSNIIKWHQNDELTYLVGERIPKSVDECRARYLNSKGIVERVLAIEDIKGRLIGQIEIDNINWIQKEAELFIYIGDRRLWGGGYGSDALTAFIKYFFDHKGFQNVYLRVYEKNKRAIRCYEKCGFKKMGILKIKDREQYGDNLILMTKTNVQK